MAKYEFVNLGVVGGVLTLSELVVGGLLGFALAGLIGTGFALSSATVPTLFAMSIAGILTLAFALIVKGWLATVVVEKVHKVM